MITFSVSALEKAPVNKSGILPEDFLDLAPDDQFSAAGEGNYDLTASLVSGGMLLSGSAAIPVGATCGRCLAELEFTLDENDLHIFFELADGQETVDVDEELRAELLLNLPMNPLCAPDCQGLCPECGCDLNETRCNCEVKSAADKVSPWSALDSLNL